MFRDRPPRATPEEGSARPGAKVSRSVETPSPLRSPQAATKTLHQLLAFLALAAPCTPAPAPASDDAGPTLADVASAVVYFRSREQAHEPAGGQPAEVWYAAPGSTNFFPKMTKRGGTGFLISHGDFTYVVTANHVATNVPLKSEVHIQTESGSAVTSLEAIQLALPGSHWFSHPVADLAVLPVPTSQQTARRLSTSVCLPGRDRIPLLADAYALGFPFPQGDSVAPCVTRLQVSAPLVTLDVPPFRRDLKVIALDRPLFFGSSGSPVLIPRTPSSEPAHKRPLVLVGIFIADIGDEGAPLTTGIALPISYLLELLDSPDIKSFEAGRKVSR